MTVIIVKNKKNNRVEDLVAGYVSIEKLEEMGKKDYNEEKYEFLSEDEVDEPCGDIKFGDIIDSNGNVNKDKISKIRYILEKEEKIGGKVVNKNRKLLTVNKAFSEAEKQEAENKFGKIIDERTITIPSEEKKQFLKNRADRRSIKSK